MTKKITFKLEGKSAEIAQKIQGITSTRKTLLSELKQRTEAEYESINKHSNESHNAAWAELGEELDFDPKEGHYELDVSYFEDHDLIFMVQGEDCGCGGNLQSILDKLMQQGGGGEAVG